MELGCFIPAVYKVEKGECPPKRPRQVQCQIRERLGRFVGVGDLWWDSSDQSAVEALKPALIRDVPIFFQKFGEVKAILEAWRDRSLPFWSSHVVPVLLHEERRDQEARQYIQKWRKSLVSKGRDPAFLSTLEVALGLKDCGA